MTMTTYTPLAPDRYELCHPMHANDFETIRVLIDGEMRAAEWRPIPMEIIRENEGTQLMESDAPWLGGHALIFRSQAAEVLKDILVPFGELLPLQCPDAQVLIYNPKSIPDALDEGASSTIRCRSGRIMEITRHVFRPDVVRGVDLFKIPNLRVSRTYVSQRFVDRWNATGLRGLEFQQVWAA